MKLQLEMSLFYRFNKAKFACLLPSGILDIPTCGLHTFGRFRGRIKISYFLNDLGKLDTLSVKI